MTSLTRRTVTTGLMALPASAWAQSWPASQVTLVAPFPPGGSVDAICRMVQPLLQQRLGATVIVENKPGATGSLGAAMVAKAKPDGSSWLFVFDTHAVNPALLPQMSFDTEKDLEPVLLIGTAPHLICCHPTRPWKSFTELMATAKEKPGVVTYASIGAGSLGHLTMVQMTKRAGISLNHVPYRGGGPALNDAIAGHVDLIIASTALVAPQIAGGGLRPLLQTGKTRLPAFGSVPTAIETGFEGFESYAWWGVFAPKGTPAELVDRFGKELVAAMNDERVKRIMMETQNITLTLDGPAVLRQWLGDQMRIWGAVVRDNGIKPGQ